MNADRTMSYTYADFEYFTGLMLLHTGEAFLASLAFDEDSIHRGPLTVYEPPDPRQEKTSIAMKASCANRLRARQDEEHPKPPRTPTSILPPGDYEPIICITCGQPAKHEAFGQCRRCYGVVARARRTAERNLRMIQSGL